MMTLVLSRLTPVPGPGRPERVGGRREINDGRRQDGRRRMCDNVCVCVRERERERERERREGLIDEGGRRKGEGIRNRMCTNNLT